MANFFNFTTVTTDDKVIADALDWAGVEMDCQVDHLKETVETSAAVSSGSNEFHAAISLVAGKVGDEFTYRMKNAQLWDDEAREMNKKVLREAFDHLFALGEKML